MKRRLAREIAVSSLYQMEMNEVTAAEAIEMLMEEARSENEIGAEFVENENTDSYVRELVNGVAERKAAIDDMLQQHLTGWQVDRLSRVDRQVLRLACYEMVFRDDVPHKASINEAIELAKHFGTEESGKFVNGVLGKLMQSLEEVKKDTEAVTETESESETNH
ncbi:transcription antitermination factor NusB [Paenibacillus radicis (ex Gao et al. 2016)]|uniref:Transcription antitermination protein NusB n=1 Tax=Paenibacillus radicis (ex Gao et al. 2016) TaxID=1737354 RepID=A0A917GUC4_9BACL|nr:transcription antitermination factor NusB [Paenibacillus radicis (ex Gao et al. 2016)]GGG56830.1 N utilization substance protein B [Paenibacillus radicis (ex Gao et al. 2016)]